MINERPRKIGLNGFADIESEKIVDNIQDKIVLPAILTTLSHLQCVLKAAKDFFTAPQCRRIRIFVSSYLPNT
jgi:hypothetical protein